MSVSRRQAELTAQGGGFIGCFFLATSQQIVFFFLLWGIGGVYTMDIGIYENIYGVLLVYSLIVMSIKRFHDTNRSGWKGLWVLIPAFGVFYILIVCGFFKGTHGENKYGESRDLKSFTTEGLTW